MTYSTVAPNQSPLPTSTMAAVIAAPNTVNRPSRRTRARPLSAIAPNSGARRATRRLAAPFASPSLKVLCVAGTPAFQNCLKKSGKNPAMTVVANDELAQSYIAHPNTGRRVSTRRLPEAAVATPPSGGMLTRLVERNVRPALHGQLQVDSGGCEIHE